MNGSLHRSHGFLRYRCASRGWRRHRFSCRRPSASRALPYRQHLCSGRKAKPVTAGWRLRRFFDVGAQNRRRVGAPGELSCSAAAWIAAGGPWPVGTYPADGKTSNSTRANKAVASDEWRAKQAATRRCSPDYCACNSISRLAFLDFRFSCRTRLAARLGGGRADEPWAAVLAR